MEQQTQSDTNQRAHQLGKGLELFVIFLVNTVFQILTLGIYHFWGKTRVRRYLWSQTEFDGERFEYTGNGMELFIGFLKGLGIVVLVTVFLNLIFAAGFTLSPGLGVAAMFLGFGLFVAFTAVAVYGARRYLMSRTRLRSVRFAQTGSSFEYANKALTHGLLTLITLGFYHPYTRNHLTGYLFNNSWYGNEQFSYDGNGKDLMLRFAMCWVLTIPTLGLIWVWYKAAEHRYVAEHLSVGDLRFKLDVTGGALLWLAFSNLLLLAVTLGLAFPWVVLRNLRFTMDRLSVDGELDYVRIAQTTQARPTATADGVADVLDVAAI